MFHFILGECGTGKSTELMHRIRKDLEQDFREFHLKS